MQKKSSSLRPHQIAILGAGAASLVAWALPLIQQFMLPLQYLNTHIHELCHALAGQLSGASVDQIVVYADGSGKTPMLGGSIWLVGPAGYVGAAIVGGLMMYFSRTESGARITLRVLAIALGFALIMWVRGDAVGVGSIIVWIVGLAAASRYMKGMPLLFAAQFLGLQQCLNAIHSVYTLMQISAATEALSEARIMEKYTMIPAFVWALMWCAFSLIVVVLSLRRAWSESPNPDARPAVVR